MGFNFVTDGKMESLPAESTTTLSTNETPELVVEDLTQEIFAEGEEEKLAIQFIEENELYTKFLLWCGVQEQLKKIKESLGTQE